MQRRTFAFEFQDDSPDSLAYELDGTERLHTVVEDGVPFVFANRAGMLALAKLLIKMASGSYADAFHVHLRRHFSDDAGTDDALTLLLDESVQPDNE